MIRPLRQKHRVMVCTLGVLLPVAFAAGIAARRPVSAAASVPSQLTGKTIDFGQVVWMKEDLWPNQRIVTRLRRDATGSMAVELICRDLVKPDVLVYCAAGKDTVVESLPEHARLIGALSNGAPLSIPVDLRGEIGRFVLYSLADHEVVAGSRAFIVPKD